MQDVLWVNVFVSPKVDFATDMDSDAKYKDFEARHSMQLMAAAVPKHFWRRLHEKLIDEIFDAGEYFQILEEISEHGEHNYSVMATKEIDANDSNKYDLSVNIKFAMIGLSMLHFTVDVQLCKSKW